MNDEMYTWTIYNRGALPMHPEKYVARKWRILATGPVVTGESITSKSLKQIRDDIRAHGFVWVGRQPDDIDTVLETWI